MLAVLHRFEAGRSFVVFGAFVAIAALLLSALVSVGAVASPAPAAAPVPPILTAGSAAPPASHVTFVNWPTYLSNYQRTSANLKENTLAPTNISKLTLRWSFKVNATVAASPTVVNGTVYIGSWNGYEYALRLSNGSMIWKQYLGTSHPYCPRGGVDSSATYWNNTIYVGGGDAYWYALNASTGAIKWKVFVQSPSKGNYNWASALLYNGHLFIGVASCDDNPLVAGGGRVLKVNLTAPNTVDGVFLVPPPGQLGGDIWSSPSLDPATGRIWLATGNDNYHTTNETGVQSILAFSSKTLKLLGEWQVPKVFNLDDDFGAPAILFNNSKGVPLVGSLNKDGTFYTLNRTNVTTSGAWKPVWQLPSGSTGQQYVPAAFAGGTLYDAGTAATIGGKFYQDLLFAVNPLTGAKVWQHGFNTGGQFGAVTYADGMIFAPTKNTVQIVYASNGTSLKGFALPFGSTLTMGGSLTVVDGQVLGGTGNSLYKNGTLGYVFDLGLPLSGSGGKVGGPEAFGPKMHFEADPAGGLPPYTIHWQFGDGASGSGANVTHRYDRAGWYWVSMTIADQAGGKIAKGFWLRVGGAGVVTLSPRAFGGPGAVSTEARLFGATGLFSARPLERVILPAL